MFDRYIPEPIPWRKHAVLFTPWSEGRCECGREDWLRWYAPQHTFACLECWLGLPTRQRTGRYHGFEDDARLRWLWEQVRGGRL